MFCNELRSESQPVYKLGKSTQRTVSVLLMLLGLEAPACYSCRCVTDVVRFVLSVCITVRAFMVSYREHTASWHLIGHADMTDIGWLPLVSTVVRYSQS